MSASAQRSLIVSALLAMMAFGQASPPRRERNWTRGYVLLPRVKSLAPMARPPRSPIRPAALTSDNWLGGTGNWNVAANWSAGIPNNGTPTGTTYNVFIDNGNPLTSVVTLNQVAAINNLTIDSKDSLAIANGQVLTIAGTSIANAGGLSLNSTGNNTELVIGAANVTLSGGTLTMTNNANNYILGSASADTLTNQETIQGAGHIGTGVMTLVNSGTINANQSAGMTLQTSGGTTNTGTIEATGGATMLLTSTTVTNTGGTISANGGTLQAVNTTVNGGAVALTGASTLQLTSGVIHGGSTLTNSSTGTIEALAGANTLGGTINNPAGGVIKVDNGAVLNLENGSYPTLGTVNLNSTGSFTELVVAGANVTMSGGTVTMTNNANNYIFGAASADTLTNQETIQGAGHIGNGVMTLVNSGTINANQSAGMTIQTSGGTTNTGTIEATGGATLALASTTVTNTGGSILANTGTLQETNSTINGGTVALTGASTLQLTNGAIHSGSTLTNSSTGTLEALAGTNTLGGTINNPAGGVLKIDNGAFLNLENGSYPTLGTVNLNSTGSFAELIVAGANVTLSGGTVTMTNNANNYILGAASADTLTNQETIQGAGHIGNGVMTLVNSGTINANQSAGMTIQTSGGTTNTGTIEATGGATLALVSTTVTNTGGSILANTGTLQETNSTINGGTVALTGASTLQLTNGVIHGGSTLTNSSTGTIEALAGTNTLGGTINNSAGGVLKIDNGAFLNLENGSYPTLGTLTLNSTGNFSELIVGGANVTLSGGAVTMTNNVNNYIVGAASADTLTNQETIQGAGHIGNGSMTLVNSGTINANQSAGMTLQTSGGTTNTGTIEATGGATLALVSTTVTNTGGSILANTGTLQEINSTINGGSVTLTGASTLQLTNGVIHSGSTLTNSSTGTIEALAGTSTLGGTLNNQGGVFKIDDGAALNLENGSYPTLGTVNLNSAGGFSELIVAGANVTLSGGTVTMTNNANNYIFGAATVDTLTNQETIQGAGHIGNGQMTLVNQGTINANQSAGMTIQASGGATNTGIIEATSAPLSLIGMTITNTGGTILANGSTLQEINGTINGGNVTLTGASTLQLTNGIIHSGSTLTNNASGTIEVLAGANTLGGSVNNPAGGVFKIDDGAVLNLENGSYPSLGTVSLNSAGSFTDLEIAGANVTLSGGTVTMTNNANNYIFGAATADTLTNQETIQGAGHIGNGQMTLVNSGTINANQSAGMTIQANGGVTNTGIIEATSAPLSLIGMTVTNTGGTISASGSTLQEINATINGGAVTLTGASTLQMTNGVIHSGSTLSNSTTGTIEVVAGSSTLGGTVVNPAGGVLKIDNGAVLNLENGTYPTLGTVTINASVSNTVLEVNGANVTLSGGTVTMSNNAQNFINAAASADTLTNQETIQGSGNIGNGQMGLTNTGTISANQSTPLIIQPSSAGFTNTGTLQVSAGDLMHVLGGPFTNFAGGTLSGGTYGVTGTLEIDQLGSTGGEIVTDAANITLTGAASTFVDAAGKDALANLASTTSTGSFALAGGRNFTTIGNFTNGGTLTVGAGSKFAVNGNLTNFSGTTLTGGVYKITGNLQFNNANIVTNAANITLTGANSQITTGTGGNGLANFATNASGATFALGAGRSFTTAGNFTNRGALTIGSGDTFNVNGNLTNFTGTTLSGGTYNVTGTLQFNGANIATNAANITLTGTSSKIVDQTGANALANFATNAAGGKFTLASNQSLTTAGGNFTNSNVLTINKGSTFTVGGSGFNFTQTAGTTTVDGTLTSAGAGTLSLNGGTLFGGGMVAYSLVDASAITPGDSATKTGILTVSNTYTQSSGGALNISISGTTVGTKYDQLKITSGATLTGTLNVSLLNGFTPTVGSTFDILNAGSLSGTFSTVNGLSINGTEHFAITYTGTDTILTVTSGAAGSPSFAMNRPSFRGTHMAPYVPPARTTRHPAGYTLASVTAQRRIRPADFQPAAPIALTTPDFRSLSSSSIRPISGMRAPLGQAAQDHARFECGVDLIALLKTSPKRLLKSFASDSDDVPAVGYVVMSH